MKTLFIVESPGKIKTISKLLGPTYDVQASFGHLRDLPKKSLGVDTANWRAKYEATNEKSIKNLKAHHKNCNKVVLATDDDREGEAIAWHIAKVLDLDPATTPRVTFSEITKSALQKAIANVHTIDMKKVAAQEARRILDRILGYQVSRPLNVYLSQYGGLSAGRVQSVAVKIVSERELAIRNFNPTDHFGLIAEYSKNNIHFKAEWDYKKHFNNTNPPPTINGGELEYWTHRSQLEKYANDISRNPLCHVIDVNKKKLNRKPPAPFITSTFQMACSTKFKLPPKKAMQVAQKLYENGLITYMRTDNPNLSEETIELVNKHIELWCEAKGIDKTEYTLSKPNKWKAKGDAQEAHEAIRPTDFNNTGESISDSIEKQVYQLIFKRTVACQMSSAVFNVTKASIETSAVCNEQNIVLTAKGNILKFPGWKAYISDIDENAEDGNDDSEAALPNLVKGDQINAIESGIIEKKTKPPSRFTEASLIKELEKEGIGRPSTYASIMSTILSREYIEVVDKASNKLSATKRGIDVYTVLDKSFTFMDISYTRKTEEHLDSIAKGKIGFKSFMNNFYEGFQNESDNFGHEADEKSPSPTCKACNKRKLIKVKNKKRPGYSWLCPDYSSGDCKTAYPDVNGKPNFDYVPPQITEHRCPLCKGQLTRFSNENSYRYYCKPCKAAIPGDKEVPDYEAFQAQQKELESATTCPSCNKGKLVKKKSSNSDFYACNTYPKCKTSMPVNSDGEPDIAGFDEKKKAIEAAPKCSKCKKGKMLERKSQKGPFLGCSRYPKCKNTEDLEERETA